MRVVYNTWFFLSVYGYQSMHTCLTAHWCERGREREVHVHVQHTRQCTHVTCSNKLKSCKRHEAREEQRHPALRTSVQTKSMAAINQCITTPFMIAGRMRSVHPRACERPDLLTYFWMGLFGYPVPSRSIHGAGVYRLTPVVIEKEDFVQ